MSQLITQAYNFAYLVHSGQVRKYTGLPYLTHCAEVALILTDDGQRDDIVCAGYLHDVLEDTPTTAAQLHALFGVEITALVLEVTDVSRPADGNRAKRKRIDRDHLAQSSPGGATVKLADLISNTRDIVKHDKNFGRVFTDEKVALLEVLSHGSPTLYELAHRVLEDAQRELALG